MAILASCLHDPGSRMDLSLRSQPYEPEFAVEIRCRLASDTSTFPRFSFASKKRIYHTSDTVLSAGFSQQGQEPKYRFHLSQMKNNTLLCYFRDKTEFCLTILRTILIIHSVLTLLATLIESVQKTPLPPAAGNTLSELPRLIVAMMR